MTDRPSRLRGAPQPGANADGNPWQSHLGYDPREDERPEAFVFCPECAEREFGDA